MNNRPNDLIRIRPWFSLNHFTFFSSFSNSFGLGINNVCCNFFSFHYVFIKELFNTFFFIFSRGTKLIFKSLYPFLNKEGKEKMDLMLSKFDKKKVIKINYKY